MENQPIKQENEVQSHETAESALINAETEQAAEKPPKKAKPSGGTIYKYVVVVLFLITFGLTSAVLGIKIYLNLKGEPYDKLFQIEKLVSDEFFGEVDEIRLEDYLASAYIASLDDDYAFYKNAKDGERVEDSFVGNTTGIGVTVYSDDESKALAVYRVDLGSPADEAGVKAGDKIIAIDGKKIADIGYNEALSSIQREVGTTAEITLLRQGKEHTLSVVYKEFVRQTVYPEVVSDYGFITITAFNDATVKQFEQAYSDLLSQKVKGLIFDLRDNGGGTVKSSCKILDTLLGKCDLITYRFADGTKKVDKRSDAKKCDLPMAVLVNSKTASASELFAANLRDMANAPLIGNNTYGKGVVQRTYFLDDGSCIRFTIGEFLPAGGEGFNGKGLAPDCEVSFTDEELANKFNLGENDPYLKKAIDQLNKLNTKVK